MLKSESANKVIHFGFVGLAVMVFFVALNWLTGRFLAAYPPKFALHYLLSKHWTLRDASRTDGRKLTDCFFAAGVTFVIQWPAFTVVRRTFDWPPWCAAGVAIYSRWR